MGGKVTGGEAAGAEARGVKVAGNEVTGGQLVGDTGADDEAAHDAEGRKAAGDKVVAGETAGGLDIDTIDVGRPKIDRIDGFPERLRRKFLKLLIETGNVEQAARAIGRPTSTIYNARARDPNFRAAWAMAAQASHDRMIAAAERMATEGMVRTSKASDGSMREERYHSEKLTIDMMNRFERHATQAAPADDDGGRNEDVLSQIVEARLRRMGLLD